MKTNRLKGFVIGIAVSLFYGLITLGPVNFKGRIIVAFGLMLKSAFVGLRANNSGAPWYLSNGTTLGGYRPVAWPFTIGLSWGMTPIIVGTLGYVIGHWCGWWG